MREIEFRGYNKETQRWYEGMLGKFDGKYYIDDGSGTKAYVDEESIGQYTGFKDYKGNKIFEGDKIEYLSQETGTVDWDEESGQYWFNEYCAEDIDFSDYEVVGNIYEDKLEDFVNE